MKTEITIKITVDKDNKLKLNLEQAKELYMELGKFLEKEKEYISYPAFPYYNSNTVTCNNIKIGYCEE